MIERKNMFLNEAGRALEEVWAISKMLKHTHYDSEDDYTTLLMLVGNRLGMMSYNFNKYLTEADIAQPEAVEGDAE